MTPCSLTESYRRFGGNHCLRFRDSTLNFETLGYLNIMVTLYQTTRRHIREGRIFHRHRPKGPQTSHPQLCSPLKVSVSVLPHKAGGKTAIPCTVIRRLLVTEQRTKMLRT
jgi:hypothetical protein